MKRERTNITPILLIICCLLSLVVPAYAWSACSGCSTLTAACTTGTTSAQVNTCLGTLPDGGTINVGAGSYSWGAINFSNSKGASLIGAGAGSSNVTLTGQIGLPGSLSGTNTKLYRVSGFTFAHSGFAFWFYGAGTMTQLRIDHNTFNTATGGVVAFLGENTTIANFAGLIDHNTMNSPGSSSLLNIIGATNPSPPSSPFGTANNMFVEDNTIAITTMTDAGQGCMDAWGGASIVWRRNTSTNCLVTTHGVTHAGGPANVELYNNTMKVDSGSSGAGVADGYRLFHHQGSGEFIAFNNIFKAYSGHTSVALSMLHYRDYPNSIDGLTPQCDGTVTRGTGQMAGASDGNRSGTYGYPCWRQPGRDFAGNLKPMYVWNNYWSDTAAQVSVSGEDQGGTPDYKTYHMVANREWYNAVSASAQTSATSPFNGTTGMGFGTLANRPTTCTTNSAESGGGVGYFATDQGPQGTLYRCSSTNTWTVHYTPYTYPHPLASGQSKLSAPTLRISQN